MPERDDIDCHCTDNVVCPHCGCEHDDDPHEMFGRSDTTRTECDDCGLTFEVSRDFSVHYSSSKIDHEQEARDAEEAKQKRAAQIEKCRRFPPGTAVRVTAGHRAGTEGVVANREVGVHVRIESPEGKYITSADPDDVVEVVP